MRFLHHQFPYTREKEVTITHFTDGFVISQTNTPIFCQIIKPHNWQIPAQAVECSSQMHNCDEHRKQS